MSYSSTPETISIDNQNYDLKIIQNVQASNTATRILIPTLILSPTARRIVEVCVGTLQKFTLDEIEIWLIDNNSDLVHAEWLSTFNDNVNVILNRTEPIDPYLKQNDSWTKTKKWPLNTWKKFFHGQSDRRQMHHGSYANAIGIKLGQHYIAPDTPLLLTLHSDTLVTKPSWLRYFKSKLTDTVRGVGFRKDFTRVQALHVAGLLIDYTLCDSLNLDFMPNTKQSRYPDRPVYDVGDYISMQLWANGYQTQHLQNTYNRPELKANIAENSPFYEMRTCDLCFDNDGDVCFMHLGRGTLKSINRYRQVKLTKQWIDFAEKHLL